MRNANQLLLGNDQKDISREILVAFTTLAVFCHHYPSLASDSFKNQLRKFSWIREREMSRYLKQRRIAISAIQRELAATAD